MSDRKWVVSNCNYCYGKIEFESEHDGELVECPHCKRQTVLFAKKEKSKVESILNYPIVEVKPIIAYYSDRPIEEKLETAGRIIFWLGIAGAATFTYLAFSNFVSGQENHLYWLIFAVASLFQGWIVSLLFRGFAEIIRLLRKK